MVKKNVSCIAWHGNRELPPSIKYYIYSPFSEILRIWGAVRSVIFKKFKKFENLVQMCLPARKSYLRWWVMLHS